MKKIIAMLMVLLMLLGLAACSNGTTNNGKEDEDLKIYKDVEYWDNLKEDDPITWKFVNQKYNRVCMIIPDTTQEFYSEIATTVGKMMEEAGYKFDYIGVNSDPTTAIAAIETWVTTGTDAIIIMAQDNTCDDALKAAMEEGVLVVSASAQIAHYHHWLLQDNYGVGYDTAKMATDWLHETYGEAGQQYIVLRNDLTQATADKGSGCEEGMKELYPEGTCVGVVTFTGNLDQVMAEVETLLTHNPDVKAVVAMHNAFAQVALQAANTVGAAVKGDFAVFGSALSEQVKSQLTANDTCYEGEIWMGDQGRQMALNTLALLNGETLNRWYYAKNFPITSDNIGTYYDDYYAN